MNPTKNMTDMSTSELKALLPLLETMTKYNDDAKQSIKEVQEELQRRGN